MICRKRRPSSASARLPSLSAASFRLFLFFQIGHALRASVNYVPQGSNPLLYQPGADPIIHLDQNTFADTVFEPGRDTAFVVEFYADWCGHCRAFAPFYRQFASVVKRWSEVVQVAAVNCADTFNGQICRSNSVAYFPMIKYFPRSANSFGDGTLMESSHSGTNLRDQLATKILNEYSRFAYADWPNLRHLEVNVNTQFEDLWQGTPPSANFLLIIFEQFDSVGVQSILDLWPNRQQIGVRRALSNSALIPMLGIKKFPYVAMFKRDDQQSIFMEQFQGPVTLDEAMQRVQPGNFISLDTEQQQSTQSSRPHVETIDCERFPDRCKKLYFVSETDLLKAVRMALLDEVTRMDEMIRGDRFRRLYNFVVLLFEHFPTKSFDSTNETMRRAKSLVKRSSEANNLQRSARARQVFAHLKQFLEGKPELVTASEWRNQFENVERVYGKPFPSNASWQHCSGSSPEFRGYTCGLWSIFHALTVHAYMDAVKERLSLNPLVPLRAIQGWVSTFFGCEHCKRHFMKMTSELFPMNEQRVSRLHDTVMYLWRAHNIVNARLHGDVTEDPQFLKYQFPPLFLCRTCHSGGHFSRRQTRNFLLRYYGSIRPYHRTHSAPESRVRMAAVSRSRN
uniref:Sulfhydryl oxidase n=1 Tax=Globodera rostochiensis TaxID=31243 RepID=A0A914HZE2_GLORO